MKTVKLDKAKAHCLDAERYKAMNIIVVLKGLFGPKTARLTGEYEEISRPSVGDYRIVVRKDDKYYAVLK